MLDDCIRLYCDKAGIGIMLKDEDRIAERLIHASFHQAGSALEWIQKAVAPAALVASSTDRTSPMSTAI